MKRMDESKVWVSRAELRQMIREAVQQELSLDESTIAPIYNRGPDKEQEGIDVAMQALRAGGSPKAAFAAVLARWPSLHVGYAEQMVRTARTEFQSEQKWEVHHNTQRLDVSDLSLDEGDKGKPFKAADAKQQRKWQKGPARGSKEQSYRGLDDDGLTHDERAAKLKRAGGRQ